jgi:DNA polymerase III alpha subunit
LASTKLFVPLHVKSDYSLGYGTASVDDIVARAAALGYAALALTDIENLYGQVRFHHQCRSRGLRALTGVEDIRMVLIRPRFDCSQIPGIPLMTRPTSH